jgi:NAD(P)-dependent dehydrogenase (short-subunit alcohol dehydrogenase family)
MAMTAYAQSKLALTMWSFALAEELSKNKSMIVALNPGSLLGSKMVKEGFGIQGKDLFIGAEILVRASLSEEFTNASGKYFDNDIGKFSTPHLDALDKEKCKAVVSVLEDLVK